MSFKDTLEKEKRELQSVKRPYETVAFLVFSLLFLQNLFFMGYQVVRYFQNKTFAVGNMTTQMNLSGFINRFVNSFTNPAISLVLAILLFALYWFLIYYFVWNYCKKHNLAKWTWTLFVVYGPGVFLITPLTFFVIYVFRPYFARFAKRFVEEFKSFDSAHEFEEEKGQEFNEDDYDKYIADDSYYVDPDETEPKVDKQKEEPKEEK